MRTDPYKILVKPIITEDSTAAIAEREPTYTFKVSIAANKVQIAQAVEAAFGVEVKKVNTLRQRGKVKRMRRAVGKRADYKKAFVTLAEGNSIDLF